MSKVIKKDKSFDETLVIFKGDEESRSIKATDFFEKIATVEIHPSTVKDDRSLARSYRNYNSTTIRVRGESLASTYGCCETIYDEYEEDQRSDFYVELSESGAIQSKRMSKRNIVDDFFKVSNLIYRDLKFNSPEDSEKIYDFCKELYIEYLNEVFDKRFNFSYDGYSIRVQYLEEENFAKAFLFKAMVFAARNPTRNLSFHRILLFLGLSKIKYPKKDIVTLYQMALMLSGYFNQISSARLALIVPLDYKGNKKEFLRSRKEIPISSFYSRITSASRRDSLFFNVTGLVFYREPNEVIKMFSEFDNQSSINNHFDKSMAEITKRGYGSCCDEKEKEKMIEALYFIGKGYYFSALRSLRS